ncbi:MAG: hypothetical protein ABSF00_03510 [Candidatus Bathyarchaeia archaeon]|jgi:hypothetical protein
MKEDIVKRTKSALKQFGFLVLISLVFLSFYGALPQPVFTEQVTATQSPIYVYEMISAKTVYYRFIIVHLGQPVKAAQVTVSTWFWLHVSIHIFVNGTEIAQVNTGDSGNANFYTPFPEPLSSFTVEVWAHNMLPLPDDFHANIVLYSS